MPMRPKSEFAKRVWWRPFARRAFALAIGAALPIGTLLAASPVFIATDLGTLGGSTSYPLAVNDNSVVVGYSSLTGDNVSHAFRWTQPRGMIDLGTLGGSHSVATAVNESGVIAGASFTAAGSQHAFIWIERTGLADLGTLPFPFTNSYATGISRKNIVIGQSWKTSDDYATHGFAWSRNTGMIDLGGLGGDTYPNAVNSDGLVVGTAYTPGFAQSRPFAWTRSGGFVDLGSLGGSYGEALAVSDTGTVVGYSYTAGDPSFPHPFVWTLATGMIDLGTLANGYSGYATAVNDSGVVVGYASTLGNEEVRAFKWSFTTGIVNLGTPTGGDSYANGISNDGSIFGNSTTADGQGLQAFAWTSANGFLNIDPFVAGQYTQIESISSSGQIVGFKYHPAGDGHATLWTAVFPKAPKAFSIAGRGSNGRGR
jgi:probable HAF family extracellular repeat protein